MALPVLLCEGACDVVRRLNDCAHPSVIFEKHDQKSIKVSDKTPPELETTPIPAKWPFQLKLP